MTKGFTLCRESDPGPLLPRGIVGVFHHVQPARVLEGLGDVKKVARDAVIDCLAKDPGAMVLDSNENIGTNYMLYRLRPSVEENGKIRVRIVTRGKQLYQTLVLLGR